jgi:predicted secreted protein
MAELINGRNVMLYRYDGTTYEDIPFACMLSCTLSVNLSLREVTNAASSNYAESEADLLSWSISGSGFTILNTQQNYLTLLDYITQREKITVKFVIDNGGVLGLSIFTGQVFISSFSIDAADDTLSTYNVELTGTGAYSTSGTTVTPGGIIITGGSIVQVFQATATDGQTSITFAGAIGLEMLYGSRGGIAIQPLQYVGTPSGNGGTWDISTGTLILATPAVDGELFLILAQ